jgi:NADH:ubiquinone oxidoreductase subunit K
MIPLSWYLILAAALFCTGLFGVLARKNTVGILMGIELMLNAVNVNLLAFWRFLYSAPESADATRGMVFAALVFVVAAAETAVALALIISAYRSRKTVVADELNILKG